MQVTRKRSTGHLFKFWEALVSFEQIHIRKVLYGATRRQRAMCIYMPYVYPSPETKVVLFQLTDGESKQ